MRSAVGRLVVIVALLASASLAVGMPSGAFAATSFDCAALLATPVATPSSAASASTPVATASVPAVAFPANGGTLTVFAAASLTDAFTQLGHDLEAAHPGLSLTFNFAGSQTLLTQLGQGAPADVFASAGPAQMQAAQAQGLIAGQAAVFVQNRLVIVVPAGNPAGIQSPADLAKSGLRLVVAGADVPAGRYGRQSVCAMNKDAATYGAGFADKVAANVVSEEEDVRAVLAKVALGEADAGIVYVSDAASAAGKVEQIAIPAPVNVLATYPIAPVTGGHEALARAFIASVLSPAGQAILQHYGFTPVR